VWLTVQVLELLGKPIGGEELQRFFDRAGEAPEVSVFEETRHFSFKRLGLCLSVDDPDTRVRTIHIHCVDADGYSAFEGSLPRGLQRSGSRVAVRSLLGPPSRCGDAGELPFLGQKGPWDRYDSAEYSLHLEYSHDASRTTLVTLMLAGTVPGAQLDS
jgi:hypothetical protein